MYLLYSRKGTCLVDYFKSLDQSKRMKVQYFSCDMNKTFIDLARIYFPNAKIVIDRYHFVRQVYWALENVRKRIQKRMLPSLRKYYKRSKSLITKRKAKLSNDNRAALEWMLEYSEDLRKAHFIGTTLLYVFIKWTTSTYSDWFDALENSTSSTFTPYFSNRPVFSPT